MRARCSKYLLIADIAKAFHQVPLRPEFRNVVKFLWVKDPEGSTNHENLVVYRFTKLPFGASSSPFILAATILLYLEMNPHEINERIKSNLYVDNVVLTTNEESELPELYSGSKKAFNNMSMNLREYMTNSKGTMEKGKGFDPSFHHCPTEYNPADLASRGVVMEKLFNNSLWFDGPEFLKNPESEWPIRLEGKISYPQEFRELILKEVVLSKAAKKKLNATAALAVDTTDQDGKGRPFIPYNRVSSLAKLTTVMGLVMRWFVRKLPNKEWESLVMRQLAKAKDNHVRQRCIARTFVIARHYEDGKSRLNLSLPTNMNLEPGEEGVYRYHRQLDNSRLSADAKNPILILRDHELATLIAREVHRMNMHIPQTYLIAAIRQKYWIPQVGTLVKQVIRRYSYSKTLPSCRTTPVAPFAHVGLDYFGPITYRTLRNKEESMGDADYVFAHKGSSP
ncbi:unnamed protein product [Caenorhabditis sp. 36 PRJEB53466]|nr:unnamed protein product [Caenorhabditis sp. 36 PRJEB53466]